MVVSLGMDGHSIVCPLREGEEGHIRFDDVEVFNM